VAIAIDYVKAVSSKSRLDSPPKESSSIAQ